MATGQESEANSVHSVLVSAFNIAMIVEFLVHHTILFVYE